MSIEVNEIDFTALKQLNEKKESLKLLEKELYDDRSPKEYIKIRKQRKDVQRQMYNIIKDL